MTQRRLSIVGLTSLLTLNYQTVQAQNNELNHKQTTVKIDTADNPQPLGNYNEFEYLINFARYIRWPDSAFATPGSPIIIALADSYQIDPNFNNATLGKTKDNREIIFHHYSSLPNLEQVQILYIEDENSTFAAVNKHQISTPLLTVGTQADFLQTGGIIQLIKKAHNIDFVINHAKAQALGLDIHYKIQQIAQKRPFKQFRIITKELK